MIFETINYVSPVIYYEFIMFVKHSTNRISLNKNIKLCYNVFMCFFSGFLFILSLISTVKNEKLFDLTCKPFINNEPLVNFTFNLFIFSKYLEWLDHFFIIKGGKNLSRLQKIHYSSTVFLLAVNRINKINPFFPIPMILNTFINFLRYGYGKQYTFYITCLKIIKHIIVIHLTITSSTYCQNPNYLGNIVTLIIYSLYLKEFLTFYKDKYKTHKYKKHN